MFNFVKPAYAQVVGTIAAPGTVVNSVGKIGPFIGILVTFITVIAGLYALVQLLLGGFGFITSAGDKGKVQENTQRMLYAIIGLVTIAASFIISAVIGRLLFGDGFNILKPVIQTL